MSDPRFAKALVELDEIVARNPHLSWGSKQPERCTHESWNGALGCARAFGHDGSHWLTGNPESARADLVKQGILGR